MKIDLDISPTEGWINSLSYVLLWPLALSFVFSTVTNLLSLSSWGLGVFIGVVAFVIHFMSYVVIGLPLYHLLWSTAPRLWTWKLGLPSGSLIGAFALVTISVGIGGTPESFTEFRAELGLGASYGLVTAAAAIVSRRELERGISPKRIQV